MDTLELVQKQKLEGAKVRLAILTGLIKKLDASNTTALEMTQGEFVYLRDLIGNQWGRENEFLRSAAALVGEDALLDSL